MSRTSQGGITLIEVLISMGVFTIITGIVMYAFLDGQHIQDLRQASVALQNDIRQVQSLAIANTSQNLCSLAGTSGTYGTPCQNDAICGGIAGSCGLVPPGGYGLSVSRCLLAPCHYTIYGDIGDGTLVSGVPGVPDGRLTTTGTPDPIVRTITLNPQVTVTDVAVIDASGTAAHPASAYINVVPPKPATSLNPAGVKATICLKQQQSGLFRLVTVFVASGQVSEQSVPSC